MKQEIARDRSRGKVQLHVSDLPFSEIPHQSRLFLEYQSDSLSLRSFYPNAVASAADIAKFAPEVIANYQTDRNALCSALTEINVAAGASSATLANIERLRDSSSVAVVTGQQAGLFSGPLYTIYKALSAVKLAAMLTTLGVPAVPVFWAATEDHDLEEVSNTFVTDRTGELTEFKYEANGRFAGLSVGDVIVEHSVSTILDLLFESLPVTEFSPALREILASAWQEGSGFGQAFIKTLAAIFTDLGLVFIDPMHSGIKRLSAPIYAHAIDKSNEIVGSIIQRNGQLVSEGYHAQVLVEDDYIPFFWIDEDGHRLAIRKIGTDRYKPKGGTREFNLTELRELAASEPQRLSPGVMLRPAVQDWLLPTVCYFGGAAEIAYFAQNSVAYEALNRPVTPILHRQSFTIVEAKQRKVLEKFDLTLPRLFDGIEKIRFSLAERDVAFDTAKLFADAEEKINTELNRLDQHLSRIDSTVAENLAKRRRKMIYHIAALRKKAVLAELRKDEVVSRQIENLFSILLPKGGLQERSINVFSFLNKFGPHFIEWLYEAIDLDDKDHRIIDL